MQNRTGKGKGDVQSQDTVAGVNRDLSKIIKR
jgi:hypothetical protein